MRLFAFFLSLSMIALWIFALMALYLYLIPTTATDLIAHLVLGVGLWCLWRSREFRTEESSTTGSSKHGGGTLRMP